MGGDSPAAEGMRQAWLHTIAGVQNKAGDMLQERIGFLTAEDEAAADGRRRSGGLTCSTAEHVGTALLHLAGVISEIHDFRRPKPSICLPGAYLHIVARQRWLDEMRVHTAKGQGRMQIVARSLVAAFVAALISVSVPSPASAALEAGERAYQRGDYATALQQLRPLAEKGDDRARYFLGLMYFIGQGVPQDDAKAAEWFRRAAEQGHVRAQHNLGFMYESGRGVPQDDAQAVDWYRKAAEQGHVDAQNNLGLMYADGRGVPRDDAQAVDWFRKAAEQGHVDAQTNLGFMYANGRGVPRDDAQAVDWLRKAAEQGHVDGQTNLGFMYANGRGVPRDDAQAVDWFRKAAEQGHARAQTNLGFMYANGRGVPQDYVTAHTLYDIGAAQGQSEAAGSRASLEERMAQEDIAQARRMARECAKKNYRGCGF